MRILNVTQTYSPFMEFGGPPVKVRALSEALVRRGHRVTVLTADWGLEQRLGTAGQNGAAQRTAFGWLREEMGVQAVYLPIWLRRRALAWSPAVRRYCREQLRRFDVVHIFGLYDLLGPAVATACQERGVPYVVEPIGMLIPIVRNFRLKQLYHRFLGRRMLTGAARVIATSEQETEELASAGLTRAKIVLRRNGVEVPAELPERGRFRKVRDISPDAKLVLFLGRLSQKKSPELLLQAFAILSKKMEAFKLVLVFAGPDEGGMTRRLKPMAAEFGIADMVQFCGPLFGDEKWAAYRDADLFVLPSQNENFGNTAGEAAAMGVPVVITDRCGIAPLLADVAGLVVAHDAQAVEWAMERILAEPGLHERLASGRNEIKSRLGWGEPAREMEVLYRHLVADHERIANPISGN